jgi:hypothetical protein
VAAVLGADDVDRVIAAEEDLADIEAARASRDAAYSHRSARTVTDGT